MIKKLSIWKAIILVPFLLSAAGLQAKVKLPSILGDNMVLQQKTAAKLWGWAKENAKIQVKTSWDKKTYTTTADIKGCWLLKVNTPDAGGPFQIIVSDGEALTLNNILIGEVWFCSGQSNMEMPMRGFDRQPLKGGNNVIAKANPNMPIRMFTTDSKEGNWVRQFTKTAQTDCQGEWLENSSINVANISATAYYFARYVREALNVPVGIIVSSWGGSVVESWMSREAIEAFKEINTSILDNDSVVKKPQATPCVLYNAKIAPLTNFTIKGFLWYQGESNRKNADLYAKLMPAFVKDLRAKWNIGEFPFYFVQIAPFNYEGADSTSAARLREVQLQNMNEIPNSGMVTTMDIGEANDLHPQNKKAVGVRMAKAARSLIYNEKIAYSGPIPKSAIVVGKTVKVFFNHLEESDKVYNLNHFELASVEGIFSKASAVRKGKDVYISCNQVELPKFLRYAWCDNPAEINFFNESGLPAAGFRLEL